jgi:hypothetical protein
VHTAVDISTATDVSIVSGGSLLLILLLLLKFQLLFGDLAVSVVPVVAVVRVIKKSNIQDNKTTGQRLSDCFFLLLEYR